MNWPTWTGLQYAITTEVGVNYRSEGAGRVRVEETREGAKRGRMRAERKAGWSLAADSYPAHMWPWAPTSAPRRRNQQTKSCCTMCGSALKSNSALFKDRDIYDRSKENWGLAGMGELAQSATCVSCTHEYLSSDSRHPCKKLGMAVHTCISSPEEVEAGEP